MIIASFISGVSCGVVDLYFRICECSLTIEHLQDEVDGFFGLEAFHIWLKLALLYEFEVEDVVDEGHEQVDLLDDQHDNAACVLTHDITQKAL